MASVPPPPLPLNVVGSDSDSFSNDQPHHSSLFHNHSSSILVIIIVLALTVIVSVTLCFLVRHLNRRCLHQLSPSPAAATTPVFSSSRRISPEIPPSTIIDSLPLFSYSAITRRSSNAEADCAVCLSKFEKQDLLRLLPLCCHAFHAECIDTWLQSNLTCPLCRSVIFTSESDLTKDLRRSSSDSSDSFRLEIGNISRRGTVSDAGDERARSRSYSIGSFDYFVDDDSEVPFSQAHRRNGLDNKDEMAAESYTTAQPDHEANLAADVGNGRSWLKDYVDRLSASISSRTASFQSSGRFFNGGSSRRSDPVAEGDYDVEANRIGEEISEMFRWLSGI